MIRISIRFKSSAFFLHAHLCLAQFTDNFSDGDFTNNPTWTGTTDFIVNASNQLQLNNSVPSTSRLTSAFAAPSLDNFEWQVLVKQTFAASGSNYGRVYLASNQSNLNGALNGYYLQFGEAGSADAIELFRQTGLISTSVCRATNGSISASFNVRVRVLRSNTGLWKLFVDYNGGTNFVQEASGTDVTHNSSSHLGVVCVYTASNANKFFFDDFLMGPEIIDAAPPSLQSVNPISSTELDVTYNEMVDPATAQVLTNYSVNNDVGNPSAATLQPGDKIVRLTFPQSFPNGITSQLTVSGVKDLFNNAMTTSHQDFLFFQPVPAEMRDIIMTEIFADPSPTMGLPEFEFVEIYNRSNKIFDLQNWKITDGSATGTLPSHLFFPNQYIILTSVSSASQFTAYGTVLGISNFPTLNNTGDHLTLKDNSDAEINNVIYSIDWYRDDDKKQGGYTLELISPDNECAVENNWTASQGLAGGTPGMQNSVFTLNPDAVGPKLLSAIPTSATEVVVQFNETLKNQLPARDDFIITPSVFVSQVDFLPGSLQAFQLTLSESLQPGVMYSITVQNIYDCPGNSIDNHSNKFVFGLPEQADSLDIVINEIFSDPSPTVGLPESEFIEIYNRSNKIFDLQHWKITDGSSVGTLSSHLFFPNQYVILTSVSSASQFSSYGTVLGISNFPTINNSGETLFLIDQTDVEINSISFTDHWYGDDDKKQGGYSIERIDPENTCAEETNWIASEAPTGGTPGTQNSVFANKPDLTGPKLVSAIPTSPTEIIVQFNERLNKQPPTETDFTITPSVLISQISFVDESLKKLQLKLSENLHQGVTYSIVAENIYDCPGNIVASDNTFVFGLPETADSLDMLINEILFNPRPTGLDFVEVVNNTQKFINLKRWAVANFEDGVVQNMSTITEDDFLLAPNQYIVFTEDNQNIKGEYVLADEANLFKVKNLPSFSDHDGTVALVDSLQNVIDFLSYSDDYHSVFLDDVEGVSLERISFSSPTNERSNWKSASSTAGFATPGLVNSNVVGEHTSGEIIVSPEIFDPIHGQPTFTQIQYHLEQGGAVANVKIFDSYGREIKQIVNNVTLGTEGFFRWDGDTNEGTKARSGYYVVWVELFNTNGSLSTYRKRAVIANAKN